MPGGALRGGRRVITIEACELLLQPDLKRSANWDQTQTRISSMSGDAVRRSRGDTRTVVQRVHVEMMSSPSSSTADVNTASPTSYTPSSCTEPTPSRDVLTPVSPAAAPLLIQQSRSRSMAADSIRKAPGPGTSSAGTFIALPALAWRQAACVRLTVRHRS